MATIVLLSMFFFRIALPLVLIFGVGYLVNQGYPKTR